MKHTHARPLILVGLLSVLSLSAVRGQPPEDRITRPPQDETIYFLLVDRFADGDPSNNRGGVVGGRLISGYDPTNAEFYQGGDLKGLTDRLGYLQKLGATAIWVSPIFRNRWVTTSPRGASASYHGYWITDFTDVDPHFGTRGDFKAFVDAAHARGIKVYLDIIVNHTADVIRYRECKAAVEDCPYRPKADYPYTLRGGTNGTPINEGFLGDDERHQTADNFARLTRPDYAYTPFVPEGMERAKKPDWLNDIRHYHNRGEYNQTPEGMLHGDFAGLDDLMTENPRVLAGFIAIYKSWITDFHIDGYRVDTARHVDLAFWRAFAPAILDHARAEGIPNFHIFGEVMDGDPAILAAHTRGGGLPYVLDFGFQAVALQVIGGKQGPEALQRLFAKDVDYRDGTPAAGRLPTFLGNHDIGRFAWLLGKDHPSIDRNELLRRTTLGYALTMFSRGVPTIYYGDEQGMVGHGDFAACRQTMFRSQVRAYTDEVALGADRVRDDHFDPDHPLFRAISEMAALRASHPGLRRGFQEVRVAGGHPGLYVFTRTDPQDGQYLIALNTSRQPVSGNAAVAPESRRWMALRGRCVPRTITTGTVHVEVPALDYIVCRSEPTR
ncbi:MAG: alpha-amylase family glycosyl hydrolase [Isosphaeraceae bacterium]